MQVGTGGHPLTLPPPHTKTRRVLHHGLAIYNKNIYLKAKEELRKLKYFTMQKIPNIKKNIV